MIEYNIKWRAATTPREGSSVCGHRLRCLLAACHKEMVCFVTACSIHYVYTISYCTVSYLCMCLFINLYSCCIILYRKLSVYVFVHTGLIPIMILMIMIESYARNTSGRVRGRREEDLGMEGVPPDGVDSHGVPLVRLQVLAAERLAAVGIIKCYIILHHSGIYIYIYICKFIVYDIISWYCSM